jgi:hypothetical protein
MRWEEVGSQGSQAGGEGGATCGPTRFHEGSGAFKQSVFVPFVIFVASMLRAAVKPLRFALALHAGQLRTRAEPVVAFYPDSRWWRGPLRLSSLELTDPSRYPLRAGRRSAPTLHEPYTRHACTL